MVNSNKIALISPCGIYCRACKNFKKKNYCYGCRAPKLGKRKAKFHCRIRRCCFERSLKFCFECHGFPCQRLIEFSNSYPGEERFHYRHVTIDNLKMIKKKGVGKFLIKIQKDTLKGTYHIDPLNKRYLGVRCSCK